MSLQVQATLRFWDVDHQMWSTARESLVYFNGHLGSHTRFGLTLNLKIKSAFFPINARADLIGAFPNSFLLLPPSLWGCSTWLPRIFVSGVLSSPFHFLLFCRSFLSLPVPHTHTKVTFFSYRNCSLADRRGRKGLHIAMAFLFGVANENM